jgi:DNA-binding GntR family transcriptional regulator
MPETTPTGSIARAERHQLKDQAYLTLREAIVDLRLPPGQPLRESVLSEQLGVSKTPVREALVRLQGDGLVTIEPYRGATVSSYDTTDLVEIYELRELLEGASARHAATSMKPEALDELRRIVTESQAALRGRKADRAQTLTALFDAFDECLLRQLANGRIQNLLENLRGHIVRIGRLTVDIPGRLDRSVAQHREIYDAIRGRDPDLAEATTRRHIKNVLEDQLVALSTGTGTGTGT